MPAKRTAPTRVPPPVASNQTHVRRPVAHERRHNPTTTALVVTPTPNSTATTKRAKIASTIPTPAPKTAMPSANKASVPSMGVKSSAAGSAVGTTIDECRTESHGVAVVAALLSCCANAGLVINKPSIHAKKVNFSIITIGESANVKSRTSNEPRTLDSCPNFTMVPANLSA